MDEQQIIEKVEELRSKLKADRLDMSFGEIINLYEEENLLIAPEYQRAYRWKEEQKTRFIESILLGIPIPPIFVAEDDDGKWELVDGLQRLSTVLSFFGVLKDEKNKVKNNFKLINSNLIGDLLREKSSLDLPAKLALSIKRSVCRVEVLRWDGSFDMRYELFNRLNTGGSPLSDQEIRNCVFVGDFNRLINKLSSHLDGLIKGSDERKERMLLSELVLRYFVIIKKHNNWKTKSNIQVYFTSFMKKETETKNLDYDVERDKFLQIIYFIREKPDLFKGKQQFSASHYDMVMLLASEYLKRGGDNPDIEDFKRRINKIKNNSDYQQFSGSSTGRFEEKLNKAMSLFNNG